MPEYKAFYRIVTPNGGAMTFAESRNYYSEEATFEAENDGAAVMSAREGISSFRREYCDMITSECTVRRLIELRPVDLGEV